VKVIVSQLRKPGANPALPLFIHTGYTGDDDDTAITASQGYEIATVYLVPDTADVENIAAVTS
jgi:hypothetical protein